MGLLEEVSENGSLLKNIEEQTEELCLAAVRSKGGALKYVKEPTPKIVLEAVKQDGGAIHFVDNPSHELIETAVMKKPVNLLVMAEKYKWEKDEDFLLYILKKQPTVLPYLSGYTVEKLCREHKDLLLEIVSSEHELSNFCGYYEDWMNMSIIERQNRCDALYPRSCRKCDNWKHMDKTERLFGCMSRNVIVSLLKDELEALVGPTRLRYPTGTFSDEVLLKKHIESHHNNALFSTCDLKKIKDMRSVNEMLDFTFIFTGTSQEEILKAKEDLFNTLKDTDVVYLRTPDTQGFSEFGHIWPEFTKQYYVMQGLFKEEIPEFMEAVFEKANIKPFIKTYGYCPYDESEWKKHRK